MLLIKEITEDSKQKRTLLLPDGTTIVFTMKFSPLQFGWVIEKLVYDDFEINNVRIVNSVNILHQFKNILPFGLACITEDNREPTQREDFSEGASKLYILTAEEVELYSENLKSET